MDRSAESWFMAADTYFNTHQIPKVQRGNEAVYVDILSDVQWNVDFVGITLLCFDIFTIFMLVLTRLKYKLGNFFCLIFQFFLSWSADCRHIHAWTFIFKIYSELKDIKAVVGIAKNNIQIMWILVAL